VVLKLALVLVAAAMAGSAFALPARVPERGHAAAAASQSPLRVSASIPQLLHPGVRRTVRVRIANRDRRQVIVASIAVGVRRAPLGCSRRSLRIGRITEQLVVPAHTALVTEIPARLSRDAANVCQRGWFELDVQAQALGGTIR
jgi:hypothetical protein